MKYRVNPGVHGDVSLPAGEGGEAIAGMAPGWEPERGRTNVSARAETRTRGGVIRFRLTPGALSRTRFAISPLAELVGAVTAAYDAAAAGRAAGPHTWRPRPPQAEIVAYTRWIRRSPMHQGLASLLSTTKWLPDFAALTPPMTGQATLTGELAQIAAMDPVAVAATCEDAARASWISHDLSWMHHADLPGAVAAALESAWEEIVAADWSRRRTVLEREIALRTSLVGRAGWAEAVRGVNRDVTWADPDTLIVSHRTARTLEVTSHFALVPTTQTRGWWTCDGPLGHGLVYGARGARAQALPIGGSTLAHLLGAGRAAILLALDLPATPTLLSEETGLALGTVGGHLRILTDAGLLQRVRTGREVHYHRTALGEELVERQVTPGDGGEVRPLSAPAAPDPARARPDRTRKD